MRILMLCESYLSIGGVAEVVDNLAAEFGAMGHQVAVASNPYQIASRARVPRSSAEHFPLRIPRRKPFSWRHPERLLRRRRATELAELLHRWRPEVANFQGPLWQRMPAAFDACRAARVPVALTLHDLALAAQRDDHAAECANGSTDGDTGSARAETVEMRRMIGRCSALTFVSAATKASFAAITPSAQAGAVILNGVDCAAAEQATAAKRSRPYVLCAARINLQHKAMDVLARAFGLIAQEYPELDLLITGDGPDRDQLQLLITSLGLDGRAQLLGVVPRSELWPLYRGAILFAMPSHKPEGLGLAFLEAMACGRPVIGTNSGGTPEIIRHGVNGLLVEHNTPEEVASAIRRMLADQAERERMGSAGREMVNAHFSWPAVARKYLEVYHRVVPVHYR